MLVSYAVYFFLQTEVIRPAVAGTDLLSRMIRDVYAGDNPYNDFPSLHTSLSTIIAIHWWRTDRRLGIIAAAWTALIVASTVFVKQHYVADVASGLLLAWGARGSPGRLLRREPRRPSVGLRLVARRHLRPEESIDQDLVHDDDGNKDGRHDAHEPQRVWP